MISFCIQWSASPAPACSTAATPLPPGIITKADLSPAAQDCLEALAHLALVLGVNPPAPAPLAAAAAAALTWQQAAQDEAEQLYELVQSLEAQVSAASSALETLKALEAREDAEAPARAAQAVTNRQAAARMDSKAKEYRRRAALREDQLKDLGFTQQVWHGKWACILAAASTHAPPLLTMHSLTRSFTLLHRAAAAQRAGGTKHRNGSSRGRM